MDGTFDQNGERNGAADQAALAVTACEDETACEDQRDPVLETLQHNTQLLEQLVTQLRDRPQTPLHSNPDGSPKGQSPLHGMGDAGELRQQNQELLDQNAVLNGENRRLREQLADLEAELQTQRRRGGQRHPPQAGQDRDSHRDAADFGPPTQSLDWEQRKAMILAQLEEENFDAEAFLTTLSLGSEACEEAPDSDAPHHETPHRDGPDHVAREAFCDPDLSPVDPNERVLAYVLDLDDERERLANLQTQTEKQLRELEIQSSLDRATLSRERNEWKQRSEQLESRVASLERELKTQEGVAAGTRWMAKLGLTDKARENG